MALHATAGSGYSRVPEGTYQGVCADVVDLGYNTYEFTNKDTGLKEKNTIHEIAVVFQLNQADENGKRFEIERRFNLSLGEKANLRGFLKSWRGRDFSEAELQPPGFDVEQMKGQNGMIQVVHNTRGEKTYANIQTIMPLFQGMAPIAVENYVPRDRTPKPTAQQAQQMLNSPAAAAAPAPAKSDDIPF